MKAGYRYIFSLSLGSNLGDRAGNIALAKKEIEKAGNTVLSESGIYESSPWGYESEHAFYNQCIEAGSHLEPLDFLVMVKRIEKEMGRVKTDDRYVDRIIDIDILFCDDLIVNMDELTIPHPYLQERRFVLLPLAEITPGKIHPVSNYSVLELLKSCPDKGIIRRLPDK